MSFNKKNRRWNTMKILAGGFFSVILIGAVLLWLPISNQKPIAFMDALFTAVTSVCVTGLVTVTPAAQFTLFGKIILLILIQIGGLGVIGCATAFVFVLRMRVSVRERILLQETYNSAALGGIVGFVRKILMGTLVVEGIGAVCYAIQFVPQYGVKGVGYAVFHAVSAFCNAGIDILGSESFMGYVHNPIINITTILLIIVSGIGFTVWYDVINNIRRIRSREVPRRWWFTRLQLHSKITIVTTVFLIVIGTILILAMEYTNSKTLGTMTFAEKLMSALFQSVTNRTAGFCTISQGALRHETKLFNCILMFIGGSPGGTAGGVKTTTVAMLAMACVTVMKGSNDIECFGRRITNHNFRTGFAVVASAIAAAIVGTIAVLVLEPDSVSTVDIIYEVISAIGTVGLSANLTSALSRASQAVIMILMYIGRLGPMTLALLFVGKANPKDKLRSFPEERIMIG